MNRVSSLILGLCLIVPSMAFAAIESWSFGASNQSSYDRKGGMGAGKMHGHNMDHGSGGMMGSGGMHGTGMVRPPHTGSGMTGSGGMKPPHTGSGMKWEMAALHMAMAKLTPEQHTELVKMIRDYLTSKGIAIPTESEVKSQKDEMKEEIKDMRKNNLDALKKKREEMKAQIREVKGNGEGRKEYVGHVTLMK